MKKPLLFLFFFYLATYTYGQGCVSIRHFGVCSAGTSHGALEKGDIQAAVNYRYFKSFRHFRGTHEETDRVTNGTEVINNSHNWEYSINYWLSGKTSLVLGIPMQINTRSSLYEHGRTERNMTFSRGLGDVRVGVQQWLLAPGSKGWNLQLGSSLKLPTGNFNSKDIFYNVGVNGTPEVRPVDQSIQLGDGGFGVILESQLYVELSEKMFLSSGAFYLVNPRETNKIRTFREKLSPTLANESIMSVPDQFSTRVAINYSIKQSGSISMGARYEGVPVKDIVGGSAGFRRPGNILSLEPGFSFMKKNIGFNVNVPVALRRNRPQSVTDLDYQKSTGTFKQGDAAFADYALNIGIQYLFKKKQTTAPQFVIPR
ncbi:MAG: hypothetical protein ACO1NS_00050 [Daejeonella sp.]